MKNCLQDVLIEAVFGKKLRVYSMDGSLIEELDIRVKDKHKRPPHPEHEEINEGYREKKDRYRSESVKRFIERFKADGEDFIEGLRKAVSANMYWHIEEILRYTDLYSTEAVSRALRESIEMGAYHKNSVRRLLEGLSAEAKPIVATDRLHIISPITIKRPLSQYRVHTGEVLK